MNLISKKDLLAMTGISYGQLYRWKRQQLIPEEWFIKKASYTGQETFFPREQVLSRIETILQLKDQHSMEELAKMFTEQIPQEGGLTAEDLVQIEELPEQWREKLPELLGKERVSLEELVAAIFITSQNDIPEQQQEELLLNLPQPIPSGSSGAIGVFPLRGNYHLVIFKGTGALTFDQTIHITMQAWSSIADPLMVKYKNLFKLGGISYGNQ